MSSEIQNISSLVTAGSAVAGLLGAGLSFVWVRFEVTHRAMKKELRKCEERERQLAQKARARRSILTTVIELLWQEITRISPHSPIFSRAKHLLDGLRLQDLKDEGEYIADDAWWSDPDDPPPPDV